MMDLEIQKLSLALETKLSPIGSTVRLKIYRPAKGEKFVAGPLPLHWFKLASRAPGKALSVGIILWFRHGLEKSIQLSFNQSRWKDFGLNRDAARRGLKALENAGLVTVQRAVGKKSIVTIILTNETIGRSTPADEGGRV